jgi:chromosome segregation ATPase
MADNDWEIVPERDDALIKSRKVKSGDTKRPAESRNSGSNKKTRQQSGDSMALWSFIFLLVFASLGGNIYLYLSLTDMQAENLALDTRVIDLESKLSVTDESLSESGAAMQALLRDHAEQLEFHFEEIDKLWGVSYRTNRPAIEELKSQLAQASERLTAMGNVAGRVTSAEQRLESVSSQSLIVAAEVEELATRLRTISDSLNSQRATQQQLQAVQQEQADAIEAIDDFRLQTNQRILRLETPNP